MGSTKARGVAALFALAGLFATTGTAQAATFPVNSTADPGTGTCDVTECTLREAIAASNVDSAEADLIPLNVTGTINMTGAGQLFVETPTTITGPGANLLTIRRGVGGQFRIITTITPTADDKIRIANVAIADAEEGIYASGPGTTEIDGVWVHNNVAPVGAGGGGIISEAGSLIVRNSAITDNQRSFGGGLSISAGSASILNSTIAGNKAKELGGGIYASGADTTVTLSSSTVYGNIGNSDDTGAGNAGGLYNNATGGFLFGSFRIGNSILAGNTVGASTASPQYQCAGSSIFSNHGFNLRTTDDADCDFTSPVPVVANLLLGTPGNHGGPTPTVDLLSGSPAIDNGRNVAPSGIEDAFVAPCPATDQRGLPREALNDRCDIGAFEVQKDPPPVVTPEKKKCKKGFRLKRVKTKKGKRKLKCVRKKRKRKK